MQIVFLCGGLGTRLNSISNGQPKALISVKGKPFLYYILEKIYPYKPSHIHFCLGYKSDFFLEFFKTLSLNNIKITYSLEDSEELLGTGGAIKNALNFLEDNFIVQYGDTILDLSYSNLFTKHIKSKKKMTMSIIESKRTNEVPNVLLKENPNGENIFRYNKLCPPENANFIDYGAIVFKKKVFATTNKNKFDLAEIQKDLTYNNETEFFKVSKPYIEIGTPDSLLKAKELIK